MYLVLFRSLIFLYFLKDAFANIPRKDLTVCTGEDPLIANFKRPIFTYRICDGISDCPNSEDELDGLGGGSKLK